MKKSGMFLLALALLAPTVTLAQMLPPVPPGGFNPGYHFGPQPAPPPQVPRQQQQRCVTRYNPWTRQYETTCY